MAAARITTVIPTYRRPKLLLRAITSSLGQEGATLEVKVFDNASGDETGSVVKELSAADSRLRYHCHASNIGGAANFDYGLKAVDTPFFSILSDDDYLLPDFYRRALEDLDRHPEAMFWAGITLNVDEQGTIWDARVDRWEREGLFAPPGGLLPMMHGMAPVWTGILWRREVLETLGYPDPEALGPADLDFILRVASRHPYVLRKHPAAVFTLNSASFSATQPLSSFWPGWQKMFRNVAANDALDAGAKAQVLGMLRQDARRMLFRRSANALALGRYDYCRDAIAAFEAEYGKGFRPLFLRLLTGTCSALPWMQRLYTLAYRSAERRLVRSRSDLEARFGGLIRRG